MAHRLQLPDASGAIAFDFTDRTGASNPHGLKAWPMSDLALGFSSGDPVFFDPSVYPGGLMVRRRERLVESTFHLKVDAAGADELHFGVSELDRLLKKGGTLEWQPDGGTTRFIDFETGWTEGLLRGQDASMLYIRSGDWDGLPIVIVRQPGFRFAELDSDTNKLRNPFLLFDANGNGRPDEWTWDSTTNITAEEINAPNAAYSFAIATAAVRSFDQQTDAGIAAAGDVWTFSFYAKGAGARARAVVRFQNSAGTDLGTDQAGTLTTLTSAWQRISVTTAAAPANASRARVSIRIENADATSYTVYLRRVQFEEAATASSFVGSTEIVPHDPTGQIATPATAPTAAAGAAGNVNVGSHSWKVAFRDATGSTIPGPKSNVLNVDTSAKQVNLTNIPLGPAGTTARDISRTVAGDTGNHKLVTTINDNTTTIYTDNTADASLGADAPTINTTAEKAARVILVDNGGTEDAPFIFEAKGDSGAQVQAIGFATLSALEDGGKSLSRWLNGPRVIQCEDFNVTGDFGAGEDPLSGVDTADSDASGGRAVVYSTASLTNYRQLLRIELTDTDALEGYRGASDVRLRLKVAAAIDLEFQMRWADSMEEPASIRALPVRHNTNIDGLATFGYVEITLGRIALPTEGTLEGLTIEVWVRRKGGATNPNLSLDCLVLVPTEKASIISLPYTARALVAENTANATLGSRLGALRWRVTWRYSVQTPSATYEAGFRVRRDSVAGTIIVQRDVAHATDITNATVAMEFSSLAGVSYFTTTAAAAGTGTLTIHEVIVEKLCILENGQTLVTDPRLGIDRAYQQSATGAFMCSAVGAPIPFWLPPDLTAVYVEVMEPRIGGQYSELASNLRRLTTVSHRYAPRDGA